MQPPMARVWHAKCDRCGAEEAFRILLPRNEEGFEKMEQMMREAGWRVATENRTYDMEHYNTPDPERGNVPEGDLCPACNKAVQT